MVNTAKDTYSESKEFYFYSDKLTEDNPEYQIENWSGVDPYVIAINVSSMKNDLLFTTYDVNYEISCTPSNNNIICQLSKNQGIIYSETNGGTNMDSFSLIITPNALFNTGDSATVEITAKTTEPYEKVLKATITLVVAHEMFSYEIIDSFNNPYLTLNMINSMPTGVNVQLVFDPQDVVLDVTSSGHLTFTSTNYTAKGGFNYISDVSFDLNGYSSETIRFYKIDRSADYTYPITNPSSIINVTAI